MRILAVLPGFPADATFPVLPAELKKLITDAEKQASQKGQILARMATLTPRELETLIMLSYGGGVAEVAQQLNVSPKTLKSTSHTFSPKAAPVPTLKRSQWRDFAALFRHKRSAPSLTPDETRCR